MRKPSEIATAFAPREALDGKSSFFLVGIGGAGMSALARMLKHRGFTVTGTDSTASPETARLTEEGIPVLIGHSGEAVASACVEPSDWAMVLTDAVDLSVSPEVAAAKELGVPILRRSQLLGWLVKDRKVIAVTGTHGKTTTTGMLGSALMSAGLDPLVVVGASIPQFGGPVVEGKGEWAVVEACEAYDGFHDIDPHIVLLTNLELDHVDFHGTYENLRDSVIRFVQKVGPTGRLVYCAEDAGATEVAQMAGVPSTAYAIEDFGRIMEKDEKILFAGPGQYGRHNHLNASGALVAAEIAGVEDASGLDGVVRFKGAERRQQVLYGGGVPVEWITNQPFPDVKIPKVDYKVIDDYAHHPTEVRESLRAIKGWFVSTPPSEEFQAKAREKRPDSKWSAGRLIVVFQPHLYSRTAPLIEEFAQALDEADVVVLTDIYPAREAPMPGISSARIAEKVTKPVHYIPSRHLLPMKVAAMLQHGDVVVGMGAGNISEFAPALVKEIERGKAETPAPVVVLYGGDSAEREVSLHSGRAVHAALKRKGYDAKLVDMTDLLLSKGDLSAFIGPNRPRLAFLAVHGTHAEDGAIQGLLELLHIPYTGSGIQASSIAMDKAMTKQVLIANGIRVPIGNHLTDMDAPLDIRPPLIVKPNAQGSTVGLTFVEDPASLCGALATAFAYDDSVLVEEWITGMEISVPVLDDEPLLPVEIAPTSGRYDFASKYLPGATEEIVPARLSPKLLEEARAIALKAHRALGCAGATRTDMIVRHHEDPDRAEIFVLEVNTLPGMTATSLLPNSAAAAGIDFDTLCQRLVEDALRRHAKHG